jgi:hypothetical protein
MPAHRSSSSRSSSGSRAGERAISDIEVAADIPHSTVSVARRRSRQALRKDRESTAAPLGSIALVACFAVIIAKAEEAGDVENVGTTEVRTICIELKGSK